MNSAILAQKKTFSEQLQIVIQDLRTPWFNLHKIFDELPLTVWAFRVYAHLVRRGGDENKAIPGYQSIGEKCFRASMPEASPETLRRKAIMAVQELEQFGLITVTHRTREDGGNTSNLFKLTHTDQWNTAYHPGEDPKNQNCSMSKQTRLQLLNAQHTPGGDPGTPRGVLRAHPKNNQEVRTTQKERRSLDHSGQDKPDRVTQREGTETDQPTIEQASLLGSDTRQPPSPTPSPKSSRLTNDELDQEFEHEFWPIALRKVGKQAAKRAYRTARKHGARKDLLLSTWAKANQTWKAAIAGNPAQIQYVPHPRTWLSQGRYEDEELQPQEGTPQNEGYSLQQAFTIFQGLKALEGLQVVMLKDFGNRIGYRTEGFPGQNLFTLEQLDVYLESAYKRFGQYQVTHVIENSIQAR